MLFLLNAKLLSALHIASLKCRAATVEILLCMYAAYGYDIIFSLHQFSLIKDPDLISHLLCGGEINDVLYMNILFLHYGDFIGPDVSDR